ncbi:endonuclease/exonuclease/phosphatase family protein [Cellulosimicrobium arenosum]|uniref:Endonuclease/exonuclease/phosphatase family protein n=1 Tax=Cellulosimicrobium arenosum TaxID=2708133 RepID=A0A927G8C6_9MICO|nr:endonuclease/exonuclease/phosphatase family protein [Cellulosimicrobium arenosum]MBD8078806.1 endonuclease/exonuclease/phosphatase family protein [Cellulosimicrobium arenosum]
MTTATVTRLPTGRVTTRRRPGGRIVTVLLTALAVVVVVMTLVRAVPYDAVPPLAQVVGFTPWVAALAAVTLVAAALARRGALAAVVGVCVVAQAFWVVPYVVPGPAAATGSASLRVLGVNAWVGSADAEQVVDLVRDEDVQVLAVVELTEELRDRLVDAGIEDVLPHHVDAKVANGSPGSGLWSALPLSDPDTTEFSTFAMPSATVEVDGTPVRVTAVHPVPPLLEITDVWHTEMLALADRAQADPTPQVLVGDFNSTYEHATFRRLLGDRFHDATRSSGSGLDLSWSLREGQPPVLDLDHVVTDRENVVTDVESLQLHDSDHRALVATVHVLPAAVQD